MRCFARWEEDKTSGICFRDQTILQFGENWDLLANFILLNPGSAIPLNSEDKTQYLRSKALPFFVEPDAGERYFEFSIDRLMNDLIKLFSNSYSGGVIRLYNLFNLKNQHSEVALEQFSSNSSHAKMFANDKEIKYCDAPVIIASGSKVKKSAILKQELIKYIKLAPQSNLYKLSGIENNLFSIIKATLDESCYIDSYHPSYTFKYGNSTNLGELAIIT
ncbi:MAG: hypothetical protein KAI69_00590 [Deltaproteobacteria bacterium]|nr:hypothetical protein [Deltaproteobacteria bacterium]